VINTCRIVEGVGLMDCSNNVAINGESEGIRLPIDLHNYYEDEARKKAENILTL
jgi:hypothetical protein